MKRLLSSFGVRALLATIALVCYELIIVAALILLAVKNLLTFEGVLAVAGLAQAPAMLAVTFYFNAKQGKDTQGTPTVIAPPSTPSSSNTDTTITK
jgi:uncharacterized membrane protein YebE (DUF533 family)